MEANEIVVGVDGSGGSAAALQWAVDHATPGTRVVACNIWQYPFVAGVSVASSPTPHDFETTARASTSSVVDQITARPEVRIDIEVEEGPAALRLIRRSAGASMLVVGGRSLSGVLGLVVGSVATQCVNHSSVPVVVVPANREPMAIEPPRA